MSGEIGLAEKTDMKWFAWEFFLSPLIDFVYNFHNNNKNSSLVPLLLLPPSHFFIKPKLLSFHSRAFHKNSSIAVPAIKKVRA
jgi:hypothetical protein